MPVLLRAVACDACWDDAVHFPGRELGQIDAEMTVEQLSLVPRLISPTDECRTAHFGVCPAKRASDDSSLLLAIWRQHRQTVEGAG